MLLCCMPTCAVVQTDAMPACCVTCGPVLLAVQMPTAHPYYSLV